MITYAQLDDLSARAADWLRERGVAPGDRVGIMLPNVAQFPVLYYGVLRAGGTVVPMNPLLKAREIEHYLGDSGAKLVFATANAAAEATTAAAAVGAEAIAVDADTLTEIAARPSSPEIAARADDDTAVILYTSGTTGTPEGRRADPRQPAPQRRRRDDHPARPRARRRRHGLPAAVPQLRPDVRAQRRRRRGRLPDPDPPLRSPSRR